MKTFNNKSKENQSVTNADFNLDSLINELKERDEKTRKTLRNFSVLLTVLVIFYFVLLVINPDKELTLNQHISGVCYVVAFIVGAIIFRNEYKKLSVKNYSSPLLTMLKKQTEKLKFFSKRFYKMFIVPVILSIGLSIAPPRYIPTDWGQMKRILFVQIVFWSVMIIAGVIAYFIERKKNQAFLDSINVIIKDLENQ
jgi:hypothetical protein